MRGKQEARRIVLAAASASLLFSGSALAATGTLTVTGTTQAALTVTCDTDLRFGIVAVEPGNAAATITVNAAAGSGAISSSNSAAYPAGISGPGACTVANETGADATATLSAGAATFSGTTLSGVTLTDAALNTMTADVTLSKASGIGNETLYIGGTLMVPAMYSAFGDYSETITITVTD